MSESGTSTSGTSAPAADRRLLALLAAMDLGLFAVEAGAGQLAGSQALKADALGLLASGAAQGLILWTARRSLRVQRGGTLIVAAVVVMAGIWTALTTLY